MSIAPGAPAGSGICPRCSRSWRGGTHLWIIASFLIASALAGIALNVFGAEERGTALALRITARWSFVLFWLAYAGRAMAKLFGSRLDSLARRGRELGLAFASAQLVHVALVIWLYYIATEPIGAMMFFWIGTLCVYVLALLSMPRLRRLLDWGVGRLLRTIAIEYIALVFAYDFILGPLRAKQGQYPLSYLPFALMLVGGASLRMVVLAVSLWPRRLIAP